MKMKHKYMTFWDNESCVDGHEEPTFAAAKSSCFEILYGWMESFDDDPRHSDEDWDMMICNCSVWVTKDGEGYWYPSDEDEKRIGWIESHEMSDAVYEMYAKAYGWPKRKKGGK